MYGASVAPLLFEPWLGEAAPLDAGVRELRDPDRRDFRVRHMQVADPLVDAREHYLSRGGERVDDLEDDQRLVVGGHSVDVEGRRVDVASRRQRTPGLGCGRPVLYAVSLR
jgi:hypothetical protein